MSVLKGLFAFLLIATGIFAQSEALLVTAVDGIPVVKTTSYFVYSGTDIVRKCFAHARPATSSTGAISAASNASAAVLTHTGHGFPIGTKPIITLSGGTGNWVAINGTRIATVIDANTFSVAVDSSSLGALAGTVVYSTNAPRTTVAMWAVQEYLYESGVLKTIVWGAPNGTFTVAPKFNNTCASPAQMQ